MPPPIDFTALHRRTLGDPGVCDELLSLFRTHAPTTFRTIESGITARDAETAAAAAHRLRGSAATISAVLFAKHCGLIEAAARSADWPTADAVLAVARPELLRCLVEIDRLTPPSTRT